MRARQKWMPCFLLFGLILGMFPSMSISAAKGVRLSSKKITITKGQSQKIKIKNTKKNVEWKIVSGEKYIVLKKKEKTTVTIKGKEKGKATVQAAVGKKKFTCIVTVKDETDTAKNKFSKDMKISWKTVDLLGITYGKLKKKWPTAKAKAGVGSQYYVSIPKKNIQAHFYYSDPMQKAKKSDSSVGLVGKLKYFVPQIKKAMGIKEFAKRVKSPKPTADSVTYTIKNGNGTPYDMAEKYVIFTLPCDNKVHTSEDGGFSLGLYVALEKDNKIHPNAYTWLRILAG